MRIEAADRAGLERLLRYCARPPFAMNRLKQRGADLVYRCGKGHTEPMQSDKYSGELVLTPLELMNRLAQLVPLPRTHQHRYYRVLAPNSPKPKPRSPSPYLWAALIARIYEVFPLLCPMCGGQMRIIAFITFSADIYKILEHIGVDPEAPRIAPARGPPLWDDCGAQEQGETLDTEPDWDMTSQSAPDYPEDQRTVW